MRKHINQQRHREFVSKRLCVSDFLTDKTAMQIVYEDNHIIIVSKQSGEIVQGDKTGDEPLSEKVKAYLKEKYQKPGAVFLGVVHRLDRPVGGLVMFARTSKALTRLNKMFAAGEVHKTYWAIVESDSTKMRNDKEGNPACHFSLPTFQLLEHWLTRNERQNKAYAYDREVPGSKLARLRCRQLAQGDRYALVEVQLMTGRHHQIRCQLSAIGCPIKGDLKYGARRSNADGSISLLARRIAFTHPVSGADICIEAPLPDDPLWQALAAKAEPQTAPQTSA